MDAVLLTGVYGVGKSAVAAEIAEALERRGVPYGAVDLDWLLWFHVPGQTDEAADHVYLANVADVAERYRAFGVRHLVLARSVRDSGEVRALAAALGAPVRVVRLEVPLAEIVRRLGHDPTSGRQDDLAAAEAWLAEGVGNEVGDLVVANDGSVPELAERILEWLGWLADVGDVTSRE